jgi:hypothetical protein
VWRLGDEPECGAEVESGIAGAPVEVLEQAA